MDPRVLARYNSPEGAESYRDEYRRKLHRRVSDRIERRLFERLFARTGPLRSILDVPCGRGRLRALFRRHAELVVEADWSFYMLCGNRSEWGTDGATPYVRASALALPFADRSFDCVVSVRLNHHIDDVAEREQHVRELMRVAERYVIFTYFSYHSLKNLLRRLRRPFNKKRPKATLETGRVAELAREDGFRLVAAPALSWIGSGHRFALLERTAEPPRETGR